MPNNSKNSKFVTKYFLRIMLQEYKTFDVLLKNQRAGANQEREIKNYTNYFSKRYSMLISKPELIEKHFKA